ncbi:galactosylceramide sulfotransferase-like [Lytechinus variegatus]|uniref:galactosylceramide sulfotransferase-like n=1 Tax=Lytechinus variegatus TaxID=7654 RepID=UPI001BB12D5B|nr:galactosylceramide sulfotransferase-like [Lytechinus variegatus]XP_041452731.1 galactosylceramide sulfotransferase-like [Lytechinus variegatus]
MRYLRKLTSGKILALSASIGLCIYVLLLLSSNQHASFGSRDGPWTRREFNADGWLDHLHPQPIIHRSKNRLDESNTKNDVIYDAGEDDRESSVSGDNAGDDESSYPVFSHPFGHPAPAVRRIYPKDRSKSKIAFKPVYESNTDRSRVNMISIRDDSFGARMVEEKRTDYSTDDQRTCKPQSNIVYVKTHKTGSSTLQNIIYRYGDERRLTFALPSRGVYIQSVREFEPNSILPVRQGKSFNIMANHQRFFYESIKNVMPPDTKYITIIRKSADQFRSMYSYFVMENTYMATLEQYSLNPEFFYKKYGSVKYKRHNGRDPMLFDLGMERSFSENPKLVQDYIQFLDSKFHLVLIMEYFFESLILLKNLFCWDMRSLVHVHNKIKVSLDPHSAAQSIDDERAAEYVVKRLDWWNRGDVNLYTHFNRTLWEKIDAYGKTKMEAEVAELKDMCDKVKDQCMDGTSIREISRGSMKYTGLAEYVVKQSQMRNSTCRRLAMTSKEFLSHLRTKHINSFRKGN